MFSTTRGGSAQAQPPPVRGNDPAGIPSGPRRISSYRIGGVLGALIAVFVIFTVLEPSFIGLDNLGEIVVQSSIIAVVALGVTLVIIAGGIDLSVGSTVGLVSVVCALNLPVWGTPLTIALGLVLGAALGLLNGYFTAYLNLQSFIVTLATLNLFRGFAFLYTDGRPIFGLDDGFRTIFAGSVAGVQSPIIMLVAVTGICWVILTNTRLGTYLRAVGNNPDAARKSGVRVRPTTLYAFTLCGVLCALAALMLIARIGAAEPITGTGFELTAIAAVVVGGTSLTGGRGSILGTILGAILLGSIRTGLTLLNVNPYVQYVVTGAIILIAVLVDRFFSRKHATP